VHVEVGAGVSPRHQRERNFGLIGQHDGPVAERVRRNRHDHPAADGGVNQRAARRKRISGGARGRRHDEAVGALVGHEMPVHLDAHLDHAGCAATVEHHIVERQRIEHGVAIALHAGLHECAALFVVLARKNGGQDGFVIVERDVGDEAQAPLVHAHQRHAKGGQFACDAEHRSVAAHHHGQVALLADGGRAQRVVIVNAVVRGGLCLEAHLVPQARDELGNIEQDLARLLRMRLADQCNVLEYGGHAQITTQLHYNFLMLDDRAKLLLKTLVERYIADGQPVGSRTLSKASGLELSAATIRNVMSDLEELGLIASPHTSAGRIPTARGYRLFVDTMLTVQRDGLPQLGASIEAQAPQKVISQAASMLSNLSQFVGVVMAPRRNSVFRHIEFLRLSEKRYLVIIVSPDGDVQNRVIFTRSDYTQSQLIEAANYLNAHFGGMAIEDVRERIKSEVETLRGEIAQLMQAAVQVSSEAMNEAQDDVVIAGEHNLLAHTEFNSDMGSLRRAFDLFEQKAKLIQLLDISSQAEGVRIYIGGESQVVPVQELSIVSAPYEVDGKVVGTLGVIGPTRMPYDRMIQIVDITSKLVSNALSHRG